MPILNFIAPRGASFGRAWGGVHTGEWCTRAAMDDDLGYQTASSVDLDAEQDVEDLVDNAFEGDKEVSKR